MPAADPRFFRSLSLAALLLLVPGHAAAKETEPNGTELARVRTKIRALETDIRSAQERMGGLQRQLMQIERTIGEAVRSLYEIGDEFHTQQQRRAALIQRREQLQILLVEQRKRLAHQLRATYAMGHRQRLRLLLNQENPARMSRVFTYYDFFNRARAAQVEKVKSNLAKVRQVERELVEASRRLAELETQKSTEKLRLKEFWSERDAVISSLDSEIRDKSARLARLLEDEERLETTMESLHAAVSDSVTALGDPSRFQDQKGRLPWPSNGRIAIRFGAWRNAGKLRWSGIVIRAKRGEAVRAVSGGRVIFADWLRGFGLVTIIDHGDGYMSLYGYNQSLYADIGDWVEAGEAIASVGNSGAQVRTGLYFAIRYRGQPIDPGLWCVPTSGGSVGMIPPGVWGILQAPRPSNRG